MIWKSVSGCVIIQISGSRAERLLNLLSASDIPIRDVHRIDNATIVCTIAAKHFKRLHLLRRKTGCTVSILRRLGIPFFFIRAKRRQVLLIGAPLLLGLAILLSTRVWRITVIGCQKVPERVVLCALEQKGIAVGCSRTVLEDLYSLSDSVQVYDDRIAWAGLSLQGVLLTVKIVEAEDDIYTLDKTIPCDVVAVKDGIISRVEPLNGKTDFLPGMLVLAGDTVIRGDITKEDAKEPLYVHAMGNVFAYIRYEATATAMPFADGEADTGRTAAYSALQVLGRTLFATASPFESSELRDVKRTRISECGIPVYVLYGTYYEREKTRVALTRQEMIETAVCDAEAGAFLRIPKDAAMLEKNCAYFDEEGCITAIVTVITEESIGMTKEIALERDGMD